MENYCLGTWNVVEQHQLASNKKQCFRRVKTVSLFSYIDF